MNSIKKSKYISTKNSMFHVNLPLQEYDERGVDVPEEEEIIQPDLFPGEVVIATANNVLKFSPGSGHNTGISGTLYITNLRLILHTTLPPTPQEQHLHHLSLSHLFLGPHDIELCLVAAVYQLDEYNQRRKPLDNVLPDRVPGIQLILKNFRVVNLSFKFSPIGEESKVIKALLHHTSPASVDLLFLTPGRPPPVTHIPSYRNCYDWLCELERTRCPGWRVTQHNEHYNLSESYPPALVVPSSLLDKDVERAAHHFRESRPLAWLWGAPGGAALVTMAHISPNIGDTEMENFLVRAVHRSHPNPEGPVLKIVDLDRELPQPLELHNSCTRLRNLHLPDGTTPPGSYLSRFEGSRWLSFVSKTLEVAQRVAVFMAQQNLSVILQEGSGRDSACIVGTLVEVMCDPYARTLRGLHAAIAKHWVALGHPFTTRLGHTRHNKQLQGPCFLLLLDCLHQLCVQQPHLLEFSPQYLAALWSAAHSPLYTTCLFDSTNNRHSTITVLQRESRCSSVEFWDIWSWWASCCPQLPSPASSSKTSITSNTKVKADKANGSSCNSNVECAKLKSFSVSDRAAASDRDSDGSPSGLPPSPHRDSDGAPDGAGTTNSVAAGDTSECSESCRIARRSFLSPLYVHQLFLSLLSPGAVDRITDPLSIAHHTWDQIRRLLFPQLTQHLPYNTSSTPPIFPQLLGPHSAPRQPSKSKLPAPLDVDPSIPRLEPWVGLFAQWLPEQGFSAGVETSRNLCYPQDPHLLFWDIIYKMYDTVNNYLNQPSSNKVASVRDNLLANGLKL